jgi:hypothetical protein
MSAMQMSADPTLSRASALLQNQGREFQYPVISRYPTPFWLPLTVTGPSQ